MFYQRKIIKPDRKYLVNIFPINIKCPLLLDIIQFEGLINFVRHFLFLLGLILFIMILVVTAKKRQKTAEHTINEEKYGTKEKQKKIRRETSV